MLEKSAYLLQLPQKVPIYILLSSESNLFFITVANSAC